MWYALRVGLPFAHALALPHGQLLDLIAVQQIKAEGFAPRRAKAPDDENNDFWDLMARG